MLSADRRLCCTGGSLKDAKATCHRPPGCGRNGRRYRSAADWRGVLCVCGPGRTQCRIRFAGGRGRIDASGVRSGAHRQIRHRLLGTATGSSANRGRRGRIVSGDRDRGTHLRRGQRDLTRIRAGHLGALPDWRSSVHRWRACRQPTEFGKCSKTLCVGTGMPPPGCDRRPGI